MSKRKKITSQIDDQSDKEQEIIKQLSSEQNTTTTEKGTVRVTLDIPKPLHAKIKAYTKARGQSIKGYLLFLASQDMDT